jgi:hypothetical protein
MRYGYMLRGIHLPREGQHTGAIWRENTRTAPHTTLVSYTHTDGGDSSNAAIDIDHTKKHNINDSIG